MAIELYFTNLPAYIMHISQKKKKKKRTKKYIYTYSRLNLLIHNGKSHSELISLFEA